MITLHYNLLIYFFLFRMLKTPHFNCRMNALKEVSRLIDESKAAASNTSGVRFATGNYTSAGNHIGIDQVVEWMAENRVLSAALEGNIDQVQYTDRIKSIVEFLGTRLSNEELSKVSQLGCGSFTLCVQGDSGGRDVYPFGFT